MNKASTLTTSALALILSFSAVSAQNNANDLAKADVKTNLVENKKDATTPAIRKGTYTDAVRHAAQNDMMVIHLFGREGTAQNPEPFNAEGHAKKLQPSFGDTRYTDNPKAIVVFCEETGKAGPTMATVLIDEKNVFARYNDKNEVELMVSKKDEIEGWSMFYSPQFVGKNIDKFNNLFDAEILKLAQYNDHRQTNNVGGYAFNKN